jgi:hypothetical protein
MSTRDPNKLPCDSCHRVQSPSPFDEQKTFSCFVCGYPLPNKADQAPDPTIRTPDEQFRGALEQLRQGGIVLPPTMLVALEYGAKCETELAEARALLARLWSLRWATWTAPVAELGKVDLQELRDEVRAALPGVELHNPWEKPVRERKLLITDVAGDAA